MKEPRIKIDKKTGNKTLLVYYNPKRKDWDSQIEAAETKLNPNSEKIPIICFPQHQGGKGIKWH